MRFRNLSDIPIPKELWCFLSSCMGLGSVLPRSISHSYMYESCRALRFTINPPRDKPPGESMTGSYTWGHVSFYPCKFCSPASLTQVCLHELHHAWLDQYHPKVYQKHVGCNRAELFANKGFLILGGKIGVREVCGSYHLNIRKALGQIDLFKKFSKSFLIP